MKRSFVRFRGKGVSAAAIKFAATFLTMSTTGNERRDIDPLYVEEPAASSSLPRTVSYASSSSFESTTAEMPTSIHTPTQHHTPPTQKLGTVSLAILVFYSVSGGPFGIEPAVRAAGNFYAILGFALLPVLWSGPEALVTAELGAAFPDAAGGVAWVQSAFGKRAGWMCGLCTWMGGATDNAIYPVLFLDYVIAAFGWKDHLSTTIRWLWLTICSSILAFVNWWGLPTVGNMSLLICIVAMSPFIILTFGSITSIEPHRWMELPPDRSQFQDDDDDAFTRALSTNDKDLMASPSLSSAAALSLGNVKWAPFLNNLFWNGNSYDSCANFAADVDNPGRTFPRALGWSVLLMTAGYVVPLLVTLGATDSTVTDWVDGYLAKAAGDIMGPWLGGYTVFSAGISNIAMFQAELSSDAFQLMGMADHGYLPRIFSVRSRHGTPTYGILLCTLVIVLMTLSDLEGLIEMLNFQYSVALLMEYASFVKLRISRPDLPRPYRIPLSTTGCILLLVLPVSLTLLIMSLASWWTIMFSLVFNACGLLLYQIMKGKRKPYEFVPTTDTTTV